MLSSWPRKVKENSRGHCPDSSIFYKRDWCNDEVLVKNEEGKSMEVIPAFIHLLQRLRYHADVHLFQLLGLRWGLSLFRGYSCVWSDWLKLGLNYTVVHYLLMVPLELSTWMGRTHQGISSLLFQDAAQIHPVNTAICRSICLEIDIDIGTKAVDETQSIINMTCCISTSVTNQISFIIVYTWTYGGLRRTRQAFFVCRHWWELRIVWRWTSLVQFPKSDTIH